ncbi:proton-conducting transporter membrane subunit [Oerskovia sp. M15]
MRRRRPSGGPVSSTVPDGGAVLGEATHLTEWAGLGKRSPWLAGSFALFLLSMAGIPLTAGFIAKFTAFQSAVAVGAWPLALIGVLASAVAVFFYVRVIVLMFFTSPPRTAAQTGATSPTAAGGRRPAVADRRPGGACGRRPFGRIHHRRGRDLCDRGRASRRFPVLSSRSGRRGG